MVVLEVESTIYSPGFLLTDDLHPGAKHRFDQRGDALIAALNGEASPISQPPRDFVPDVHISSILSEADTVGIAKQTSFDADGVEAGRMAAKPAGYVNFIAETHRELIDLAESVQKAGPFRSTIGRETLIDWIIEWALARRLNESNEALSDSLARRKKEAVRNYEIIVPLYEPYIEAPFQLGTSMVRPLTSLELAQWFRVPANTPEEVIGKTEQFLTKRRQMLQARTGVVVRVRAEREYADEVAWTHAGLVAAAIRVVSKGMLFPQARTNCVPLGVEAAERRRLIIFADGVMVGLSEALLDPDSLPSWRLDRRMIQQDIAYWNAILQVLTADAPSDFERDLSRAYLLYSRIALTRDVAEKLIHLFAALESILLRTESEPIQNVLSERLAFAVGGDAVARAEIAASVKKVYGLRSRFVHHGRDPASGQDISEVKKMLKFAWHFFYRTIAGAKQFTNRDEFLNRLEERKWQ